MAIDELEIDLETTSEILATLNAIGRTEDLAFSPDNSKLAIASYELNKVLIFNIKVDTSILKPKVYLSNLCEINSSNFSLPHGIAWVNNETIIVANRVSHAVVIKTPDIANCDVYSAEVTALQTLPHIEGGLTHSTDCIDTSPLGDGLYEIYICSNNGHYVSHYILDENDNFAIKAGALLLKKDIDIPDGVTLSKDNNWLAISNHGTHKAFVYRNSQSLGRESRPNAILHGTNYPHGITFNNDQRFIFLTDAGAPFVNLYHSNNGDWNGDYHPCAQIRIMDDKTFKLGHNNEQEGGAKGISLTNDSNLIATTCSTRPLAFFFVKDLVESLQHSNVTTSIKSEQNSQDKTVKSLLRITKNMQVTLDELTVFHHQIDLLKNSHSWKITHPLRKIKSASSKYMCLLKSKINLLQ